MNDVLRDSSIDDLYPFSDDEPTHVNPHVSCCRYHEKWRQKKEADVARMARLEEEAQARAAAEAASAAGAQSDQSSIKQ